MGEQYTHDQNLKENPQGPWQIVCLIQLKLSILWPILIKAAHQRLSVNRFSHLAPKKVILKIVGCITTARSHQHYSMSIIFDFGCFCNENRIVFNLVRPLTSIELLA